MAKESSRLTSLLARLSGGFVFSKPTTATSTKDALNPSVVSTAERDRLFQVSTQSEQPRLATMAGGSSGFFQHAQQVMKSIAFDKIENDRILEMAPEVSQAASIMVPSIMSPNDLRSSAVAIVSTCKDIDEKKNARIGEILTKFFEDELHLSTTAPRWIETALYRSGAVPILILPLVTLQAELTNGPHVITSQESLQAQLKKIDTISEYGIADAAMGPAARSITAVQASTESLASQTIQTMLDGLLDPTIRSTPLKKDGQAIQYKNLIQSVLAQEALSVIDNPNALQYSPGRTETAKTKITAKTKLRYKETTLLSISAPTDKDKQIDNPLIMELPSESVIPVYTPGAPSDHIGYFVLLNEYGHPVEITPEMANAQDHSQPYAPNQSMFQQLFQAYGMADFLQGDRQAQAAMTNIYQNIVESHLKDRLAHAGFGHIGIGHANNVYRFMLSRYLQQRRTKLLFVPKDLLVYFCFKHDERGVGRSKLDEIKFILALRISLLVCRMLVAFNNAIDRKKIEINFDPNFTGNVLEHMRIVQREAIRKNTVSFTHDPMGVSQQIQNRSYTVKAKGIPGLPDYDISSEPNQKNDAAPDEQLAEDLKNLLILKLEVPAAAMNNLGEAEYSRSVVTTNLFFSRATLAKQKIVVSHLSDLVRIYTTYSVSLSESIKEVIRTTHEDGLTPEGSTNQIDGDRLAQVIAGIQCTLPPPNVAPDKGQFDALDGILSSVDSILNAVMNDDITNGNQEFSAALTNLRGLSKSRMIQKYVKDFGFGDMEIPDVDNLTGTNAFLQLRQALMNITAAIKQQDEVFNGTGAATPETPPDDQFGTGGAPEPGSPFDGQEPPDADQTF